MKNKLLPIPIRTWLLAAAILVVVVISTTQIIWQSYFTNYVERIYESNIGIAASRIASEVHTTFADMNNAVSDIAGSSITEEFVTTEKTTDLYTIAYSNVKPLVEMAIRNLNFDMLVVLDSTGAWYRFDGALSTEEAHPKGKSPRRPAFRHKRRDRAGGRSLLLHDAGHHSV